MEGEAPDSHAERLLKYIGLPPYGRVHLPLGLRKMPLRIEMEAEIVAEIDDLTQTVTCSRFERIIKIAAQQDVIGRLYAFLGFEFGEVECATRGDVYIVPQDRKSRVLIPTRIQYFETADRVALARPPQKSPIFLMSEIVSQRYVRSSGIGRSFAGPITRAGTPTALLPCGKSSRTTAPAPTMQPSPMFTPFATITLGPM